MRKLFSKDMATSFTTLLFITIGLSGVMLFFHFFDMQVKSLHEILGLAFVIVALLHVFFNWKSMKRYFTKPIFLTSLFVVMLLNSVFIYQSLQNSEENPKSTLIGKMIKAPLKKSLGILGVTSESAMAKLQKQDILYKGEKSIIELAKANSTSPFKVVAIITAK